MILEGVVTTIGEGGECHLAPMGPVTDTEISQLLLRPYKTSTTYQNLKKNPAGVFHITDDVLLIAKLIVKQVGLPHEVFPAEIIKGNVLRSCCRWYEFQVVSLNDENERTEIEAEILHTGQLREFLGFNRAKHAVIEAAILASRIHLLPATEILEQIARLKEPVQKTAGAQEIKAFQLLDDFINEQLELKNHNE